LVKEKKGFLFLLFVLNFIIYFIMARYLMIFIKKGNYLTLQACTNLQLQKKNKEERYSRFPRLSHSR